MHKKRKGNINIQWYYLSFNKEGNPLIYYNTDESWGLYAKWNKPVTKGQILHDSTYMRCLM